MGQVKPALWGKLLYGALFVAVLPAALLLWASGLRDLVQIPAVFSRSWGAALALAGVAWMAAGMLALWRKGSGLPMNAYPPARLVVTGVYEFFPHPIYLGFVALCAGAAIFTGSAGGLWLITPVVALGCAALVWGYEAPTLRQRFGAAAQLALLPQDSPVALSWIERVRCYFVVLLPWIILYEAAIALGIPRDGIQTFLPFENRLPVLPWTEAIYASVYLVVLVVPLAVQRRSTLRAFCLRAWVAMMVVFPLYVTVPLLATPRPFSATGLWSNLLHMERTLDSAAASFPSFHVIWAFMAADALSEGSRGRCVFWNAWAVLLSLSCIATGMHSIVDVLAGYLIFLFASHASEIWRGMLRATERLANSWREWRLGPARIINHGVYAGLASFIGMGIVDTLLGPGKEPVTLAIFFAGIICAALWAQWVEGSPALLRPLGFYGGMLGTVAGAFVAPLAGLSVWTSLCAIAVAAPLIQGIGRLRCLVQGCCHGRPAISVPGIRYTHPRSRVCRIAGMTGLAVHATPLYSILWNVLVALVVVRLVTLHCRTSMICGIYLLLSGLGRFVEEAYRGEPQTRIIFGMRFYQWLAVGTVVAGAIMTTVASAPLAPVPSFHSFSIILAAGCGLIAWFVSGVDFPESSRRFARLTS